MLMNTFCGQLLAMTILNDLWIFCGTQGPPLAFICVFWFRIASYGYGIIGCFSRC